MLLFMCKMRRSNISVFNNKLTMTCRTEVFIQRILNCRINIYQVSVFILCRKLFKSTFLFIVNIHTQKTLLLYICHFIIFNMRQRSSLNSLSLVMYSTSISSSSTFMTPPAYVQTVIGNGTLFCMFITS